MAEKTAAQKARVKPGTAVAVVNRVPGLVESLGLPAGTTFVEPRAAQLVFLFARTRAELDRHLPATVAGLADGAAIWVFFRKGSKDASLDMNRDSVFEVADRLGMRPLGLISIDETWSAFRLRRGDSGSTRRPARGVEADRTARPHERREASRRRRSG